VDRVLVLNVSYEPLSLVSVKRAVVLLLTDKAEVVEQDVARQLHAERVAIDVPLVIRLVRYITIPRGMRVPLSRKTLLARDEHSCQYCGKTGVPLTVEHLQPRSRGGTSSWENCVAACQSCNHRKGNRTRAEAEKIGLVLRREPKRPHFSRIALVVLAEARGNDAFRKYIV
jgi:5-methylcytosine-specific restriction endonuclease McrA